METEVKIELSFKTVNFLKYHFPFCSINEFVNRAIEMYVNESGLGYYYDKEVLGLEYTKEVDENE